ncbi:MAG TPA: response regulator transcription factor [Thermomicrobiales bacterium]|nr:response regulator transcription factor [Thermomicrobiales bacterium]
MTLRPIRILLVDDHPASREPLAELLDRQPDLTVAGQAGSVAEAQALLAGGAPIDVALVDLELPDGHGERVIADVQRWAPGARVLVLTGSRDRRDLGRAVISGADAMLHKSAPTREVVAVIRDLYRGKTLLNPVETAEMVGEVAAWQKQATIERDALARLTAREREVLVLLAQGLENRAIADRMSIGVETVRTHVASLLAKLGVDTRLQAVLLALRHDVVDLE